LKQTGAPEKIREALLQGDLPGLSGWCSRSKQPQATLGDRNTERRGGVGARNPRAG